MNSDIFSQLRTHFKIFYARALENAELRFNEFSVNLKGISSEEQVIKITEEIKILKNEEDKLEKREYAGLAFDEEWLFRCFTHRFLIYNINDSEIGLNAISIGLHRNKLRSLITVLNKDLKKFTFEDFINGTEDNLFITLYKNAPNLSDEEFIKINAWQNKHFHKLTELLRLLMVRKFRLSTDNKNYPEKIKEEIKILDNIYNNFQEFSSEILIQNFKKLKALQGYDFEALKDNEFKKTFLEYNDGDIPYHILNPNTLVPLLEEFECNPLSIIIAYPSLIFWPLKQYRIWLEMIANGNTNYHDNSCNDLKDLLIHCQKSGLKKANNFITYFNSRYSNLNLDNKEYRQILKSHLETSRHSLNSLSHRQYYNYLDNPEVLNEMFNILYTLNESPWIEVENLSRSFQLDKIINFIISKLSNTYNEYMLPANFTSLNDWRYMMKAITMDSDLLNKFTDLVNDLTTNKFPGRMPTYFLYKNFDDGMTEILNEALARLDKALEDSPLKTKTVYIQDKLKGLRKRELNAKQIGSNVGTFHSRLKEFLELEAEYIKNTSHINFNVKLTSLFKTQNILTESKSEIDFKFKGGLDLKNFFSYFNAHIDLINEDLTSEADFVLLLSKNTSDKTHLKIHLNCETVQFSYILKKLKPYFSNLTPATIERSGSFFSKNGISITATNLYKSKIPNPKKQTTIDNYFKNLQ